MAFHNGRPSLDVVDPHDPFLIQPPPTTDMRIQLQSLLDEKEKQLQLAGTLGQKILGQQMELEERINQFFQYEQFAASDDAQHSTEVRQKLQDLMETVHSWEAENEQLWGGLTSKLANGSSSARPPHAPITPSSSPSRKSVHDLPPPEPDTPNPDITSTGPSAAHSSRRAKNAASTEHDAEFAFEIGSSLLAEVRRLQSLLGERDKTLQAKQEEIDDLEKQLDSAKLTNRQQEASADKFKEENWNLEVTSQELRSQLTEFQPDAVRWEQEVKRALKQLAAAKETAESRNSEIERLSTALEELKAKHETDLAQMRKQAAAYNRDKSDLQASPDSLKTDPHFDSSPDPSPSKTNIPLAPNHPSNVGAGLTLLGQATPVPDQSNKEASALAHEREATLQSYKYDLWKKEVELQELRSLLENYRQLSLTTRPVKKRQNRFWTRASLAHQVYLNEQDSSETPSGQSISVVVQKDVVFPLRPPERRQRTYNSFLEELKEQPEQSISACHCVIA
ncbi:hypothetical protein FRC03_011414 [Tulasnella sp. 419]|nr:hypothetical protein FRC03_011414 [Tulasnella sp. 419]